MNFEPIVRKAIAEMLKARKRRVDKSTINFNRQIRLNERAGCSLKVNGKLGFGTVLVTQKEGQYEVSLHLFQVGGEFVNEPPMQTQARG